MKTIPAILFFILGSLNCFSQQSIRGRVVNESTGAAIAGSSVFISNSSRGTTTDSKGEFGLVNVPPGKQDLIISCIGYETNVFSFSGDQLPLQLKIELKIKVKELPNVMAESSVEEGWDKWGRTFMDNFVGNTENAARCSIRNEKAIRFRYYRKSNRLIAYCDEPVMLENKALGYTIKYQLENFEVNFSGHTVFYLGYALYEPLSNDRKKKQEKWEEKRQEAFNGSIMHFMRSLYTNRLAENGFEVKRMVRTPNYEKQRVKELYMKTRVMKKTATGGVQTVSFSDWAAQFPPDTISYYGTVMHQDDNRDSFGATLLTADSLIIESVDAFKALHFEDYIYIIYKNEKEEAGYLATQYPPRQAWFQRSYVTLLNDKLISIDKAGNYFDPQDFLTSGYWSWGEKMANSVPLDYEPGKK
jgi:hypothetical protein